MLHHLTFWVPDLERARPSWQWLLGERLACSVEEPHEYMLLFRSPEGFTVVLEQSPDMVPGMLHSRLRPGLNHVAFTIPTVAELGAIVDAAPERGWTVLPIDRHPIAGGAEVAFIEDRDGFEVELVVPTS